MRGLRARAVTLIERGVLRSFLHNSYTARKAGHENTGHASRSYRSTLGVGFSNLSLQTGEGVDLVDGVLVTDLLGLHAGANPITGDLSLQAFGIKIEGDERYPVENFVISGNLFELLKRVSAVGDESEWHFAAGAIRRPHARDRVALLRGCLNAIAASGSYWALTRSGRRLLARCR